jgi:hypothetical protein
MANYAQPLAICKELLSLVKDFIASQKVRIFTNDLPFMNDFDSEIFSHYYWFETVERLKISAGVLYNKLLERYDHPKRPENPSEWRKRQLAVFQSYMMLLGFSLENLIKAVSIKSYTSQSGSVSDFKDLQNNVWQVKNAHDLLAIADKCRFNLTDDEKNLLERHTEFLVWAGRYHIPKDKLRYDEALSNQKLQLRPNDHILIDKIFAKAKQFLDN